MTTVTCSLSSREPGQPSGWPGSFLKRFLVKQIGISKLVALRRPEMSPAVGTLQPKGGLLAHFEATKALCLQSRPRCKLENHQQTPLSRLTTSLASSGYDCSCNHDYHQKGDSGATHDGLSDSGQLWQWKCCVSREVAWYGLRRIVLLS